MRHKQLVAQVLSSLEREKRSREELGDGPTVVLVSQGKKLVPVKVSRDGNCLVLTTGRVFPRQTKIPGWFPGK